MIPAKYPNCNLRPEYQNEERTCIGFWKFPFQSKISPEGRKVVSLDPNIHPATIKKLLETERDYIEDCDLSRISSLSAPDLISEVFCTGNDVGHAHVSLCIEECLEGCLAELIDCYSADRDIPFGQGAAYIGALLKEEGLYRIRFDSNYGYYRVSWKPKEIQIIPITSLPPEAQGDLSREHDLLFPTEEIPEPLPCPLCGSPGKLLQAGPGRRCWHVCCTRENNECFFSFGMPRLLLKKRKKAVEIWNTLKIEEAV